MGKGGQFQVNWMSLERLTSPRMVVPIKGLFLSLGHIYTKKKVHSLSEIQSRPVLHLAAGMNSTDHTNALALASNTRRLNAQELLQEGFVLK